MAQQGSAGDQEPAGVGRLRSRPGQQDQVDVAGCLAHAGKAVSAAEGVVAASGLRGCGGHGDVVVDVDDDIAAAGVLVE